MSFEVWLIIVTRAVIALAAGEIALRYFAWYYLVRASKLHLSVEPLIIGIAMCALAIFSSEIFVVWIRAQPISIHRPELLIGYHFPEFTRLFLFVGACFLSYPVTKLQYKHTMERALIELCVRVFLIATSLVIGWQVHTVYTCVVHHVCPAVLG